MITLHDAIMSIDSSIVTMRGNIAYDKDDKEIAYDILKAEIKLKELQDKEKFDQQAKENARQSALNKLITLGLTMEEALSLGVK